MTDEGEPYTFCKDIAEAAKRAMTDEIGVPIMLPSLSNSYQGFLYEKRCN